MIVLREEQQTDEGHCVADLCSRVTDAMISEVSSVLDLEGAVQMYNLVVALSGHTNDYTQSVGLCNQFLKQEWYSHTGTVERGGEANSLLNELFKGLFRNVTLKNLRKCIDKTWSELGGLSGKEKKLQSFPNINK